MLEPPQGEVGKARLGESEPAADDTLVAEAAAGAGMQIPAPGRIDISGLLAISALENPHDTAPADAVVAASHWPVFGGGDDEDSYLARYSA